MSKGARTALGFLMVFLLLTLVCFFISYRTVKRPLPKTKGTVSLVGLNSQVRVYRDEYGIPHIFAEDEDDLYFAVGYIMAGDRLWQMDLLRRAASGKLAEIFGKGAIQSDKFLLTLGLKRTAQEILKHLSPVSRRILEAYSRGVNAFIRRAKNKLPLEFTLLNYKPEEWRIEDSIAIARLLAWGLSFSWGVDLLLAELREKLGEEKAGELFPDYPEDWPTIVFPFTRLSERLWALDGEVRSLVGMNGFCPGSNSWVVAGEKSTTGKPILANDPHLELTAPSKWYELHVKAKDLDVAGVALVGLPQIVIGHNRRIAWGLTNGMLDDADFFIEKINPRNPNQYWYQNRWEDMEIIQEMIRVRKDTTVSLQIRLTRHGPVISDLHELLKDSKKVVSLKWVGHQVGDEFLAFYRINKARNWEEFTAALRNLKVPGQNVVYADVDGNIGYWYAAAIPIRKKGKGALPCPGWTRDYEWTGFVPFEELPHLFNPPEHFIATANNKVVGRGYPYPISNLWEPPSRIERIREVLQQKEKFSVADFKILQTDQLSPLARRLIPYILKVLEKERVKDEKLQQIYIHLKGWDFQERKESTAAAIFNVFMVKFLENTFKDEIGEKLYKNFLKLPSLPLKAIRRILSSESHSWFDDVTTPDTVETMDDVILRSLNQTITFLREKIGEEIIDWRWDKLHTVTFRHVLGAEGPAKRAFNVGPFPAGGSYTTLNNGGYSYIKPYDQIIGPSTRQIVDLSDMDKSLAVTPPGQSGHPFSENYRDQVELWLKGLYHPVIMDSARIAGAGYDLLILKPKQ